MRWSATLIPTLKEDPVGAVAPSHRLMVRAGLIRRVGSGSYAYLPLGMRALAKAAAIVREEMERAGAVEVLMPILWPEELMQPTGRLEAFDEDLLRFTDRHGRPHVLAPTHEEVVTALVRDGVKSYRQLPITLYQVQTKLRDEARPRFGILRTREFMMKDAYSFSMDEAGLEDCYQKMREAYGRIFERCGLDYVVAEAESGAMGGEESHEFMVPASTGTGWFVQCAACGYAANVEKAAVPAPPEPEPLDYEPELREVETPGRTTIEQVSEFLGAPPDRMMKTIIYVADGEPVAALVRGDHEVNEAKLRQELNARTLEQAGPELIENLTGAPVGFAGPVGLDGVEFVVDQAAARVQDAVTGANRADAHLVGVVPGRDFAAGRVADIRLVTAHDRCPRCGEPIAVHQGIEVGHIFKLGTKYSSALGATFMDPGGVNRPYVMGCYGIGINRIVAAAVETSADEKGIVWPPSLAPYEVTVLPLDMSQEEVTEAAESAYATLREAGLDVLLDDRDERPGVKFKDADLVGIPVRVVVGKGFLSSGAFELQLRRDDSRREVAAGALVGAVRECLAELSSPARVAAGA